MGLEAKLSKATLRGWGRSPKLPNAGGLGAKKYWHFLDEIKETHWYL